ncbi:lytic transglycosylase domain-containing protein [Ralstonia pseudosolanacearum]|uniref:lytic transglycosylase domain-containing protein n=1 Tax=Ralstonia pseudosolanacearum TaxID=1310165 RepID=UPI000AA40327|nr:lytic transglycosylase domain-containing protein [Ralstonia pseudosolanacearum]AXV99207.1 lytic transglycosylase [Ralstonia solanacearum]AZU59703.1 lytic transglycosylase [Ralstonia solanacearum]NKF92670.1 lytic transglycosylase [Ralstonia solanacearum]NKG07112.1 lytic transglycosylase [Ralstonia solanacearum]QWF62968.1 lytic transglycosylase domain-containing protein [Ralstonia solanacearum]
MVDFNTLAQQCAPDVHPTTLQAVVRTESGFNPYAIGVVGGRLARQPKSRAEAVATAKALDAQGLNFSMGLGQVNKAHLARFALNYETVFDACANLQAGARILQECYQRAAARLGAGKALHAAISCYYSGNFNRGFQVERSGTSYVQRVAANAVSTNPVLEVVPAIPVVMDRPAARTLNNTARPRPVQPADGAVPSASMATEQGGQAKTQTRAKWDAFGDFR